MSDPAPQPPLPQIGQPDWGEDLNTYLLWVSGYATSNDARIAELEGRVDQLEITVSEVTNANAALEGRVAALEAKPDYVFNSYPWQYSNQAPPPTGNQVRFDNADLSQATVAVFRLLDSDGADRTPIFQAIGVGTQLRISDWDNAAALHRFDVTGPAVFGASDVTVPVAWVSGSGTIPNAKANVGFIVAFAR